MAITRPKQKTSRHEPSVFGSRHGSWVGCSCGWSSAVYHHPRSSSVAWADHIKEMS